MKLSNDLYLVGSGGVGISHVCDSHVYLVDGHGEMALIDAGGGFAGEKILENIRNEGLSLDKLTVILTTHSHMDHARGAAFIKSRTGCRLGIHADGVKSLEKDLWRSRPALNGFSSDATQVDFTLADGELITIGDYQVKVIFTPGHSMDSVTFLTDMEGMKAAFLGDTMSGEGRLGLTDARTNFLEYRESLQKILTNQPDALLPGHGLFCLRHASLYIANAVKSLDQKWNGFLVGTREFYPTWWARHYREQISEL